MGFIPLAVFAAAGNPFPPGQQTFTASGTFTVPDNVNEVSVVAVGGGGGGAERNPVGNGGSGGGLGWKNRISVVPGQSYTVVVGAGGTNEADGNTSYFISTSTVRGGGGEKGDRLNTFNNSTGGDFVGDGGGNGGDGGSGTYSGGGGAGGYSGAGGKGGNNDQPLSRDGEAGQGGGGGGGAATESAESNARSGFGGGVGLLGEGANGTGGLFDFPQTIGENGGAGSGGSGKTYGGGGAGVNFYSVTTTAGGDGAVRIIWGAGRRFPNIATEDR